MNLKKTTAYPLLALFVLILGFLIWYFFPPKTQLKPFSFNQLPAWEKSDFKNSLSAFQITCRALLKENPEEKVGTPMIDLQVKDFLPACNEALKLNPVTDNTAKLFFEKWFTPLEFYQNKPVIGLFTGYYMPSVKGSLTKTEEFSVPIYDLPSDLVSTDLGLFSKKLKNSSLVGRVEQSKFIPYYTREEIAQGALKDKSQVLVYIKSPVDRVFLEIEGSAVVELPDGKKMVIGYVGENGHPYTSLAGILIKKGIFTKKTASMQAIKKYFEAHPEDIDKILNQNKSFVFFSRMPENAAYGSPGIPLTPGYSMAIDRKWIPMGLPLWLTTSRPDHNNPEQSIPFNRLMIAQDVGGAIRGKVRGDVYWGEGNEATVIGGHMKSKGQYWLLIPSHFLPRLSNYLVH